MCVYACMYVSMCGFNWETDRNVLCAESLYLPSNAHISQGIVRSQNKCDIAHGSQSQELNLSTVAPEGVHYQKAGMHNRAGTGSKESGRKSGCPKRFCTALTNTGFRINMLVGIYIPFGNFSRILGGKYLKWLLSIRKAQSSLQFFCFYSKTIAFCILHENIQSFHLEKVFF